MGEITHWLHQLRRGDQAALDRLMPLIYDDLRRLARGRLARERAGHTLSPTALVNECYLNLVRQRELKPDSRGDFFAVAANVMRRLLVDHARSRRAAKRGGGAPPIPLEELDTFLGDDGAEELLALDDALRRLAQTNPRGAEVVQHRFFAGLTLAESARVLGVSSKTVQREWTTSIAWLRKEVGGTAGLESATHSS